MDGCLDQDAADMLLVLASPERESKCLQTPPVSRRNSKEATDNEKTPQKPSPERQFVCRGVKRTRDPNMLSVVYSSGGATMVVPLMKDDSTQDFNARRRLAAVMLCDNTRADVYCSWRKCLVNINVRDAKWVKFRDTFREQRFMYENLQLVIVRLTCVKGDSDACQNCSMPTRRMSCTLPSIYYYVMPLPNGSRFCPITSEAALEEFKPIDVKKPVGEWLMRIPSVYVRSL